MPRSFELPRWSSASARGSKLSQLSDESREWLLSVARIKYQIDQAALDATEDDFYSHVFLNLSLLDRLRKRPEIFSAWQKQIKERASQDRPVADDEAWDFVTKDSSIWIWRTVCLTLSDSKVRGDLQLHNQTHARAAVFAFFATQLAESATALDVKDLSKLAETLDAVQLQLRILDSFNQVYVRGLNNDNTTTNPTYYNVTFRRKIKEAEERLGKKSQVSKLVRTPPQQHRDNLMLQTVVSMIILGCVYPLFRAMNASSPTQGSTSDDNFWSQITNSMIQLAGFLTLLLPVYRESTAKEWKGVWVLTGLGCCSAIIAIPLYLKVSTSWSVFLSWMASSSQLFVVLQIALVATFQSQRPVKKD